MITATFYSYRGKVNSVPKSLGTYTESYNVNLITDDFPALTVTIELPELIKGNYCVFRYPDKLVSTGSRLFYWFVRDPVKFQNLYRYELSLDTLQTYWGGVKEETQMIERSSSITPSCDMVDTLWLTSKKLSYNIYYGSKNDTTCPLQKQFSNTARNIVLTTACIGGQGYPSTIPLDQCSHAFTGHWAMNYDECVNFSRWLWSKDLSSNLKKWFSDPLQSIISVRVFPFVINASGNTGAAVIVGDLIAESGGEILHSKSLHESTVTLDLGYVDVHRDYNDFRDYPPYSSYKLWLPYIGYHELNPAEFFTSGKCYIKYKVDLVTGQTIVTLSASADADVRAHEILTTELGMKLTITESGFAEIQKNLITGEANMLLTMMAFPPQIVNSLSVEAHRPQVVDAPLKTVPAQITDDTRVVPYYGAYQDLWTDEPYDKVHQESRFHLNGYERRAWLHGAQSFVNSVTQTSSCKTMGNMGTSVYNTMKNSPFLIKYFCSPFNESYQKDKYGRLVMTPAQIKTCSGYCKIHDCNLSMLGLPYSIYLDLVSCLESGFYIESE